ncbi:AAA family ATPase [Iocasia frigidifontis]|uniref:AAA family ATPase n=1 Tax=Iocasia fonsfrigidae TaxID=2682810 RepID=A0A8A7KKU4_9FIRM|nr:AAA family ATPase [Iocasia fonsfrigidae]QTL98704.1 AAA family ATPase [Iocasia fonsfrigidae]
MNIKSLFIKDFGIFYNELIEDISPGLLVIGGYNRSGKTSFFKLLRYIGYGFPRNNDFIPARQKHELEAVVQTSNREEFSLNLKGFAEPVVSVIKGERKIDSAVELYNGLDFFTYQQLFTISLDELQSRNTGLAKKELKRLNSILLGAGLKELLLLPQIEDYFAKNAEKIGGKNGDPGVKDFKPYYQQIEQGIEMKHAASAQVKDYYQKKELLLEAGSKIEDIRKEISVLEKGVNRLDLLKNHYEICSQLNKLESKLQSLKSDKYLGLDKQAYPERASEIFKRYHQLREKREGQLLTLKQEIGIKHINQLKNKFIKYQDKIKFFHHRITGLSEQVKYYRENLNRVIVEEEKLERAITSFNEEWVDGFKIIDNIKVDEINYLNLQDDLEEYNRLRLSYQQERERLDVLVEKGRQLEQKLTSLKASNPGKNLSLYFIFSIVCLLSGIGLSFLRTIYISISFLGTVGIGLYSLYIYTLARDRINLKKIISNELEDVKNEILSSKNKIGDYKTSLMPLQKMLNRYRTILGLDQEASPQLLRENFRQVQGFKDKLKGIRQQRKGLNSNKIEIEKRLGGLLNILKEFNEIVSLNMMTSGDELLQQYDMIVSLFEELVQALDRFMLLSGYEDKLSDLRQETICLYEESGLNLRDKKQETASLLEDYLRWAKKMEEYQAVKKEYEQLIRQLGSALNTELIRESMGVTDDSMLDSFRGFYNSYISLEDVEEDYQNKRQELNLARDRLNKLRDKKQILKQELKELATDDKLRQASSIIDKARQELGVIAEEYAVNKAAAFILKRAREGVIKRVKDDLLADASKYFKRITRGKYQRILPAEEVLDNDFQAQLADGSIQGGIKELSRGTVEQLFLAVRLNRIKEISPPLPVIIDDSFVNFDSFHLQETLVLIQELAETHQVFLLTCHPHLVKLIKDNDSNIQFWKLDDGRFNNTSQEKLIDFLTAGINK